MSLCGFHNHQKLVKTINLILLIIRLQTWWSLLTSAEGPFNKRLKLCRTSKNLALDLYHSHTKRRLATWLALSWHQPSNAFFWYDTGNKIQSVKMTEYNAIVSIIPKEGLGGQVPGKPAFGIRTNKDRMTCFCMTYLILNLCRSPSNQDSWEHLSNNLGPAWVISLSITSS